MYTKEDRKQQVISVLWGSTEPLTITQLGRVVGLRRTPYLMSIIDELEFEGWICVVGVVQVGSLPARVYDLTFDAELHISEAEGVQVDS